MSTIPLTTPATEEELIWACKVLDTISEAIDRAAAKPELIPRLSIELIQKMPTMLDALLTITQPDCRVVVWDTATSVRKMIRAWVEQKQKSK